MSVVDLEKTYKDTVMPKLSQELGDLNVHALPRLQKVVLNVGVGRLMAGRRLHTSEKQTEEEMVKDIIEALGRIGGQQPHVIRARRSIAGFKLREGMLVGVSSTLRGRRMYDFFGRLVHVALPRTRDFRGIPLTSVDQSGNLTIGIRDASIFPEMPVSNTVMSLEVTFVTSTNDREGALVLLKELGIPFQH